LQRLENGDK